MYIILCYDVRSERNSRLLKTVRKYLHSTQRSVLEGHLTAAQTARLKEEISRIIDPQEDSVRIYMADSTDRIEINQIGKSDRTFDGFL